MTSGERLKKALSFQEADRVPFDLGGSTVSTISKTAFEKAAKHRGLRPDAVIPVDIDPIQQIVFPNDETAASLRIDTRRLGLPRLFGEAKDPAPKDGGLETTDQFGCGWYFDPADDFYYNQTSSPLKNCETMAEGLASYRFPTLHDKKREVYAALDLQKPDAASGRGLVLDRNCAGLTEMAFRIRGYEQFFLDMAMDPAGAESILDGILAYKMEYWDLFGSYLRERGLLDQAAVAAECDDLGTQYSLLFSPEMLKRIVLPREEILIKHIKKSIPGIKVLFHSDGAIFDLIPELIKIGVDVLNPVQFTAAGMDLALLKKEYGKSSSSGGPASIRRKPCRTARRRLSVTK